MANSDAPPAGRAIQADRTALITMGLAIGLNVLLFALVLLLNDQLAEAIANSGENSGNVDRFGSPANAFILPIIGLATWLLAGALGYTYYVARNEAPVAYTIWGMAVLIELATWVPVLALLINP